jgi:hypothetical protein
VYCKKADLMKADGAEADRGGPQELLKADGAEAELRLTEAVPRIF